MSNIGGMVLFVCIFIIISIRIHHKFCETKVACARIISFYCILYYTVLSGIKILSGDLYKNLLESFDAILPKTYWHYSMVLLPFSIIFPLSICYINKKWRVILDINRLITWQVVLIGGSYFLGIEITNIIWCIGFVLSTIISLWYRESQIDYPVERDEIKQRIRLSTVVIGSCLVTEIFFPASELFLNNSDEFMVSYTLFGGISLVATILTLLLFVVCLCFMDTKMYMYFISFITACTILSYAQGNFMNGKMAVLDGNEQTWPIIQSTINMGIWIIVCLLFLYACKRTSKIRGVCLYICAYIALIQIFTLSWMVISFKYENADGVTVYSTQGITELHEQNNVVVFVLDWFDGQIFDEVESVYPCLENEFVDFVYYKNATSQYAFTDMALPYLITGVEWVEGQSDVEYCNYAFDNSSFLQDVKRMGYDMRIYTERDYTNWDSREYISNMSKSNVEILPLETLSLVQKIARYKVSPFLLKGQFRYLSTDIAKGVSIEDNYSIDDLAFYNRISNSLNINDYDKVGAIRIYHLGGVHMPYTMTADVEFEEDTDRVSQGIATVKIVSEYLEQMKELGVYDTATIIITADHGQNYFNDLNMMKERELVATSNPIMFVKLAEQKSSDGRIITSNAPVSQKELFPTIMKAIGGPWEEYGFTFDMIDENENRERDFYFTMQGVIPLTHFKIQGDVRDEGAWMIIE